MRIRVCDDVEDVADEWVAAIKAAVPQEFDVARMSGARDRISELLARKLAVEDMDAIPDGKMEFDEVDVLVVDYDLLYLDKEGSRTTGEGVARLARTFSDCGTIVVMNQFKGPQFDLSMRGHLDSFADLNIDAALVGEAALWNHLSPVEGQFDPTIWTPLPILLDVARKFRDDVAGAGLDAPILPLLGLDAPALAELSDTAFGFLSVEAKTADDLVSLTIRQFLERSIDKKVFPRLAEIAPQYAFNFAAHRILKWLDRAVLRPMDVLIDADHLLDRLPFLIDDKKIDRANPDNWSKAADDPKNFMTWSAIAPFHNEKASVALGKDVFDWHRISNDESIEQLQDQYLAEEPVRFYLAEDTSRFVSSERLTRFRADFHNFGDRRAIENLSKEFSYGPQRRLQFG